MGNENEKNKTYILIDIMTQEYILTCVYER